MIKWSDSGGGGGYVTLSDSGNFRIGPVHPGTVDLDAYWSGDRVRVELEVDADMDEVVLRPER